MSVENGSDKKSFSLDWLVGGVLTKLGDTFDRFTGRGWNPSSSLATSELVEKLKFLLDSEVREFENQGKFVPHIIKLKMQWNKFSTESETELTKLEHELHAAAIDHINDKLYHTYAPIEIEIKTDYFTEGVRMLTSYGRFAESEDVEAAVNVTIPNLRVEDLIKGNKITVNLSEEDIKIENKEDVFLAKFTVKDQSKEVELDFAEKKRISVGRFKENDLSIPDQSVSKVHASLVLDGEKKLKVADTGSTNGTFINGERIAYGKAFPIEDGTKVKFGTIEVEFERLGEPVENLPEDFEESEPLPTEAVLNFIEKVSDSQIQPLNNSEIQKQNTELDAAAAETSISDDETESAEKEFSKTVLGEDEKKNKEDKIGEDSEIESQFQSEEIKKSEKINFDKTQDWEI